MGKPAPATTDFSGFIREHEEPRCRTPFSEVHVLKAGEGRGRRLSIESARPSSLCCQWRVRMTTLFVRELPAHRRPTSFDLEETALCKSYFQNHEATALETSVPSKNCTSRPPQSSYGRSDANRLQCATGFLGTWRGLFLVGELPHSTESIPSEMISSRQTRPDFAAVV